ncbi:hypothetical protein RIF29_22575 [Crotalaria pallida]|uniref:Uncharacterized protein n=1 Tax=Crotalaria pallida TaxID=3830 RepID=A0AAN9F4J8_CROPI
MNHSEIVFSHMNQSFNHSCHALQACHGEISPSSHIFGVWSDSLTHTFFTHCYSHFSFLVYLPHTHNKTCNCN